jgi:hypothetical protein
MLLLLAGCAIPVPVRRVQAFGFILDGFYNAKSNKLQ